MFGKPLRVVPLIAFVVSAAACDRSRSEPTAVPPVAAVEVPAVPPDTEQPLASPPRAERRSSKEDDFGNVDEEGPALEDDGAGHVHFSTASDAGVRFWGSVETLDGGFRFRGGFSTGTTNAGDGGSATAP